MEALWVLPLADVGRDGWDNKTEAASVRIPRASLEAGGKSNVLRSAQQLINLGTRRPALNFAWYSRCCRSAYGKSVQVGRGGWFSGMRVQSHLQFQN